MASQKASDAKFKNPAATVVELFTSQSCYSCPPAEAYLRTLAERKDVFTIEYHVDYWDDLIDGSKGKWKDIFSSPKASLRQANYNQVLRQTSQVFTPQIIIDGRYQHVGSQRSKIERTIQIAQEKRPQFDISLTARILDGADKVQISTTAPLVNPEISLLFIRLKKRHITHVRKGENKGKTLASYNIATQWFPLQGWSDQTKNMVKELRQPLAEDETCALLVYHKKTHAIFQAQFCQKDSPSPAE